VVEVLQDLQTLLHDRMRLLALDVRHKTHAAGIVFLGRVVQTGVLQLASFGCRRHGALLNFTGIGSIPHCNNGAKQINRGQIPINSQIQRYSVN
jgi:hypothetical protein